MKDDCKNNGSSPNANLIKFVFSLKAYKESSLHYEGEKSLFPHGIEGGKI